MTENQRKKIIESQLRTPECIQCFAEIREQGNSVFGNFEAHAANVLSDFSESFDKNMQNMSDKHDIKLKHESEKSAIFFADQEMKIALVMKEAISDMTATIRWFLGVILLIVGGYGAVIGYNFFEGQKKADKTELELVDKKFEKYMTLQSAKDIHLVRDAYYRDIFLANPSAMIDSTNYNWIIKTLFGGGTRSGDTKWYKEYEPYKSEKNNVK